MDPPTHHPMVFVLAYVLFQCFFVSGNNTALDCWNMCFVKFANFIDFMVPWQTIQNMVHLLE